MSAADRQSGEGHAYACTAGSGCGRDSTETQSGCRKEVDTREQFLECNQALPLAPLDPAQGAAEGIDHSFKARRTASLAASVAARPRVSIARTVVSPVL